jgi:toluene monooxygenase system protein E
LRALIEHLLVAYDWGEAVVGLNLCVKPVIDELVCLQWPRAGAAADRWSTTVLTALAADCAWHRAWMRALVHHVLDDAVGTRDAGAVIAGWLARWTPRALAAARAVAPQLGLDGVAAAAACAAAHAGVVAEAGLATGGDAR